MVNIISIEQKQRPQEEFDQNVMRYFQEQLEKGEEVNYIIYKPGQSLDKFIVEQIPLLREKYPESQIKVVQYRSNKERQLLGY